MLMSKTESITKLKAQAVEHFSKLPISERLELAEWEPNRMYPSLSRNLGNLYYGIVRIWITPDGKIYANKPKGIK